MSFEKMKVQVWIYRSTSQGPRFLVLLTRPERGGFWQPVTGSVEGGETLAQAAAREAREETGLGFRSQPTSLHHEFGFEARGNTYREHAFAAESLNEQVVLSQEHTAFRWVDAAEARKLVHHESNRETLELLLQVLEQGTKS